MLIKVQEKFFLSIANVSLSDIYTIVWEYIEAQKILNRVKKNNFIVLYVADIISPAWIGCLE